MPSVERLSKEFEKKLKLFINTFQRLPDRVVLSLDVYYDFKICGIIGGTFITTFNESETIKGIKIELLKELQIENFIEFK